MVSWIERTVFAATRLLVDEDGQGLTEYALILTLIPVVAILALTFLGGNVSSAVSTVANSV